MEYIKYSSVNLCSLLCQDILVRFTFYLLSHISICMHEFSNHHITCLNWLNQQNLYVRFHTKYSMFTAPKNKQKN